MKKKIKQLIIVIFSIVCLIIATVGCIDLYLNQNRFTFHAIQFFPPWSIHDEIRVGTVRENIIVSRAENELDKSAKTNLDESYSFDTNMDGIVSNEEIILRLKFEGDNDKKVLSILNIEQDMTYEEFELLLERFFKLTGNTKPENTELAIQQETYQEMLSTSITLEMALQLMGEFHSKNNRIDTYKMKYLINDYENITSNNFFAIAWALQNKIIDVDMNGNVNPKKNFSVGEGLDLLIRYNCYLEGNESSYSYITDSLMSKEDSIDNIITILLKTEESLIDYFAFDKENLTVEQILFINHCIMSIARNEKYSDIGIDRMSLMWGILAGETPKEIRNIINEITVGTKLKINSESEKAYKTLLDSTSHILEISCFQGRQVNLEGKVVTDESYSVDFQHMMATLDCLTNNLDMEDESEIFYDTLTGWGGDLLTFYQDLSKFNEGKLSANYNQKLQFIHETLGLSRESYFSDLDLNADIDAVNLSELLVTHNLLLSEAFLWYYDSGISDRKSEFIEYYGGKNHFEELVFLFVNYNTFSQEDIRLHTIEVEQLKGILQLFQSEFNIDIPLDSDKRALYTIFLKRIM